MSTGKNSKSEMKRIRFDHEMVRSVDKESDNCSAYVKQAVREKLEREIKVS